jgi:hypothetical protein
MNHLRVTAVSLGLVACGGPGGGNGDGPDGPPGPDGAYDNPFDELDVATGCPGVYNPDQVLDFRFEMAPGDLSSILGDTSYTIVVPAQMQCNDGPSIQVGVRRKRSGGQRKVGFKVDIDAFVAEQRFYDLRKLSLENGVSEGTTTDGAGAEVYIAEYLAWRAMVLSGAATGRAVIINVFINDERFGVYVNVEQPDKRFLRTRFGDNDGWLYKKSGGVDDGLKTHETDGLVDPYADYFCFWDGNCAPPAPAQLATELPSRLDIPQLLRIGAVNAIIENTDSPLFKDNNYYWYDWAGGGRAYLPWDLDTAWRNTNLDVFTGGVGGQTDQYTDVLFSSWRADYTAIVQELIDSRLTVAAISGELDRVVSVAGPAFDADPWAQGGASGAADSLRNAFSSRHAEVAAQLAQ